MLPKGFNDGVPLSPQEVIALAEAGSEKLKGFCAESFDYVLLDPPCSALGLRPRLSYKDLTMEQLERFTK